MWRPPSRPKRPDAWENGERILIKNGLDPERARQILAVARRGLNIPLASNMVPDPRAKCKRDR